MHCCVVVAKLCTAVDQKVPNNHGNETLRRGWFSSVGPMPHLHDDAVVRAARAVTKRWQSRAAADADAAIQLG
jgi:hypothetical protein